MSARNTFVIVGGGQAAAEAAGTLRSEGFDGRIIMAADEPHLPYKRPPLTKAYLRGETGGDQLTIGGPEALVEQGVELVTARVHELRPAERTIVLADGTTIRFDRLLLATGARPRRPRQFVDGAPEVHFLRTVDDVDRLRAAVADASTAVVAGGGWIAAETAASLRQMGLEVTLVVSGNEVLEQRLGAEAGTRFSELHRRNGVRLRTGARAESVRQTARGKTLVLRGGEMVEGDVIVLGLGVEPNAGLATAAGLEVADGIVVDAHLETSADGIFAAGDVALAWHPRYGARIRLEHEDNARHQGRTAARNMLGRRDVYERVPFFYSDQFDLGIEFTGRLEGADRVVVRPLPDDAFLVFWLSRERLMAAMHGNAWSAQPALRRLVTAGATLDPRVLADPAVPLEVFAPPLAAA